MGPRAKAKGTVGFYIRRCSYCLGSVLLHILRHALLVGNAQHIGQESRLFCTMMARSALEVVEFQLALQ